jgi:phosphohistidine swiveling domain-containing protein
MKILDVESTRQHPEAGSKAERLANLRMLGYPVPAFVVIPKSVCVELLYANTAERHHLLGEVLDDISEVLPCTLYAVRSAGLGEDAFVDSQAGRFQSQLAVTSDDLAPAIVSVLDDAVAKLGQSGFAFSILVQEYLLPQRAGVIFSVAPTGEAELVIEYVDGTGGAAVGGNSVTALRFVRSHARKTHDTNEWNQLITTALQIEKLYEFAQDIEWIIHDSTLYIVQTRPITTLTQKQWAGIRYLETALDGTKSFLFEKDTLSETCPRPRPLALSLLQALYVEGGPVASAYRRIGLHYAATNQLRIFGNELYVDREAEAAALFPTHSCTQGMSEQPRFWRWHGWRKSLVNTFRLARLRTTSLHYLKNELTDILQVPPEIATFSEAWQRFMANYTTIFLVNIAAQRALANLRILSPQLPLELLSGTANVDTKLAALVSDLIAKPVGNSVSLDDTTEFFLPHPATPSLAITRAFLGTVPAVKRPLVAESLKEAQYWLYVREMGRWATVRMLADLRTAIGKSAKLLQVDLTLLYFATVHEVIDGDVSLKRCEARMQEYEAGNGYELPQRIASYPKTLVNSQTEGISPGLAIGTLVTEEQIPVVPGDKILYTNILSPELTKYFNDVSGIVSEQGGLLSHLAIVARERKLPVVMSSVSQRPLIGKVVRINGGTGLISLN